MFEKNAHNPSILSRLLVVILAIIVMSAAYLLGLRHGVSSSYELAYDAGYEDGLLDQAAVQETDGGRSAVPPTEDAGPSGDATGAVTAITTSSLTIDVPSLTDPAIVRSRTFELDGDVDVVIRTEKDPTTLGAELEAHTAALEAAEGGDGALPTPPEPFNESDGTLDDVIMGDHVTVILEEDGGMDIIVYRDASR